MNVSYTLLALMVVLVAMHIICMFLMDELMQVHQLLQIFCKPHSFYKDFVFERGLKFNDLWNRLLSERSICVFVCVCPSLRLLITLITNGPYIIG